MHGHRVIHQSLIPAYLALPWKYLGVVYHRSCMCFIKAQHIFRSYRRLQKRNILVTCGTQGDEVVGRNVETFPISIHSGRGKGRIYHKLLRGNVSHSHNQPHGKGGPREGQFFSQT